MKIYQEKLNQFVQANSFRDKASYEIPLSNLLSDRLDKTYSKKLTGLQKAYLNTITTR